MNHTSLLWSRKFWPLCFTQFFGALNDNFFKNALIIMITFQSMSFAGLSSEKLIALCGGIFIIPFFFFSAFAGRIADKYEKSQLMRYIKVLEICIITLAGVGFLINNLFILFIALFLMGVQSTLFSPLKYSYMPLQVDNNTLVEANALLQSSTFLSILLGTILGGIIIAIPEKGAFYVSLGGIILAYIGFLFSLFILKVKPLNKNTDQKNLSSTKSLIFYILKIRNIRWTI